MKLKTQKKFSKLFKKYVGHFSHLGKGGLSKGFTEELRCPICKGKGKLYPANDFPKCRDCDGSGFYSFKKKPKNHIDNVVKEITRQKPSNKSISQIKKELEKITGE